MNSEIDDAIRAASREIVSAAPPAGSAPATDGCSPALGRKRRWVVAGGCSVLAVGLVGAIVATAIRPTSKSTDDDHSAVVPPATHPVLVPTASTSTSVIVPLSGPLPAPVHAQCDQTNFDIISAGALEEVLAPLDADGIAALEFAENVGAPSDYVRSDYDWRIAESTAERLLLLGTPADPGASKHAEVVVRRTQDGYDTILPGVPALGYCSMEIVSDGVWMPATITLDPNQPVESASASVRLLATQRACASGSLPNPSDVYAQVYETDSAISVLVLVRTTGDQTCPSNPAFEFEVGLTQPVGERVVRDASVLPAKTVE